MHTAKKRYGQDPTKVVRSKAFTKPLSWRSPRKIFTCSWSDWFHKDADQWRDEAWNVIRQCSRHTFQILTKRPERIASCLPKDWPLNNVWLGVTVENQDNLHRVALLQNIPARVRFLSMEPLLGPVSLSPAVLKGIHQIIVGGESGPHARPMNPAWVLDIQAQCQKANVPFFFKQWGHIRNNPEKSDPTAKQNGGHANGGRMLCGQIWDQTPNTSIVQ